MKKVNWKIYMGLLLIMMSASFYLLEYFLFRDIHHILVFLIEDIAFLFIEVLLVTLIIHKILDNREKKERMEKLNMVIGTFYSEIGTDLLSIIANMDVEIVKSQSKFKITDHPSKEEFKNMCTLLKEHKSQFNHKDIDWKKLKFLLENKKDFLLRLLENNNLLEHESFTDLLWAVFHLTEELKHRDTLVGLPEEDYQHLTGDMNRVYGELKNQWVSYIDHLRESYPYLFSLACRTNPFDLDSSVIVRK
ncbi:hypothetical protein [Psychrilyobacter atlanticus]|uniref:hypothetical protein n=1 Tax=Psychrilyobacter atlanticus TaxID=271091 RepID=UPI00040DAEFE|nr:hypothetical protein [Psychrilyobacter atlanticus]